MILFELFNSGSGECFPEHWLVAGSTVSLISCLDFWVTGRGSTWICNNPNLKKDGSTTNNLKPYLRVKVTICDHVRLKHVLMQ